MPENLSMLTLDAVARRIFELRGQRVMLGYDVAILYGVEYRALIQGVKRNIERFPKDFTFQLSLPEWKNLKSQNVISSSGWGGSRSAPYAFTEHGALMASSILKSPRATEISLLIIRAFVWLRQTVPAYAELAAKLAELESSVTRHDSDISMILEALRQLVTPPDTEKRRIGF